MPEFIDVEDLRPIALLYPGDLYDVARVVLAAQASVGTPKSVRGYTTVNGMVRGYARLMDLASEPLRQKVARQGLPLGACVQDSAARNR